MEIADFLTPERVVLDVRARDKPQLIAEIARQFTQNVPTLQAKAVETALLARETLGSTGLGEGFALPHARIEGLNSYLGLFMRLAKPIEFEAIDGKPVLLLFVLLIPAETAIPHVAALAQVSRRFRDPDLVTRLRRVALRNEAYELLAQP